MNRIPITSGEIQSIVAETLSMTADKHATMIEPDPARLALRQTACSHANWNHAKQWCDGCGVTQERLVFSTHRRN